MKAIIQSDDGFCHVQGDATIVIVEHAGRPYPKQVAAGKMKQADADAKIAILEEVAADYRNGARKPVYFLDGDIPRAARWHEPAGDALGHYAVDPRAGTYSDAMATVYALLAHRDALAEIVERYGQTLAEIARKHPGPTFAAASKHRQEIARTALARRQGAGAQRPLDEAMRKRRQDQCDACGEGEGQRGLQARVGDNGDRIMPEVESEAQNAGAAQRLGAKDRAPSTAAHRGGDHAGARDLNDGYPNEERVNADARGRGDGERESARGGRDREDRAGRAKAADRECRERRAKKEAG